MISLLSSFALHIYFFGQQRLTLKLVVLFHLLLV